MKSIKKQIMKFLTVVIIVMMMFTIPTRVQAASIFGSLFKLGAYATIATIRIASTIITSLLGSRGSGGATNTGGSNITPGAPSNTIINTGIKRTSKEPENANWELYINNMSSTYLKYVENASETYGVRADTIMAIIYTESKGEKNLVNSSSGATGLMQIIPRYSAGYKNYSKLTQSQLKNAQTNINRGTMFVRDNMSYYNNNESKAIEAYCDGRNGLSGTSYYNKFVNARTKVNTYYTFN